MNYLIREIEENNENITYLIINTLFLEIDLTRPSTFH